MIIFVKADVFFSFLIHQLVFFFKLTLGQRYFMFLKGTTSSRIVRLFSNFAHIRFQRLLFTHQSINLTFIYFFFFLFFLLSFIHKFLLLVELSNIGFSLNSLKVDKILRKRRVLVMSNIIQEMRLFKNRYLYLFVKDLRRLITGVNIVLIVKLSSW